MLARYDAWYFFRFCEKPAGQDEHSDLAALLTSLLPYVRRLYPPRTELVPSNSDTTAVIGTMARGRGSRLNHSTAPVR